MSKLMLEIARQGPSLLEGEAGAYEAAEEYLVSLFQGVCESVLFLEYDDLVADIYVQSYGGDDGERENQKASNAFGLGVVLGLRLTEVFVPALVASNMGASHLENVEDEPTPVADIFDAGERGYAHATAFHPLVEDWQHEAFSDPGLWPYFRHGFGLVMGDILAAAIRTSEQGPNVPMLEILEHQASYSEKAAGGFPIRSN